MGSEPLNAFARTRCLCGVEYTLPRDEVERGEGLTRWRCSWCARRFVLIRTPPEDRTQEEFWPVFLEQMPSTGDTRETEPDSDARGRTYSALPVPPPAQLPFACRCGKELMAAEWMYHRTARCPSCGARILLVLFYEESDARYSIRPEYREEERRRPPQFPQI